MSKSLRLLIASALTTLAATSAHADFVTSSQGVNFTFHTLDANSFTLRIQNAPDATGDWAPASYLSFLGFAKLNGTATGAQVTVNPTPGQAITWSFTGGQLTGQGCGKADNSGAICLDADPNVVLSNDMLFTIDLAGSGIDLFSITGPALKVGFAETATGGKIGSLLSVDMTTYTPPGGGGGGGAGGSNDLPEPASLALAGLALAGAAVARRRNRA